jgi:hypothetical protein
VFQPRAGVYPIVFHGTFGHTKDLGNLVHLQAREETKLYDLGLAVVEAGELFERLIQLSGARPCPERVLSTAGAPTA